MSLISAILACLPQLPQVAAGITAVFGIARLIHLIKNWKRKPKTTIKTTRIVKIENGYEIIRTKTKY